MAIDGPRALGSHSSDPTYGSFITPNTMTDHLENVGAHSSDPFKEGRGHMGGP